MAYWWVVTIGMLLCLGLSGGVLFYFISSGLDSNDSTRVDTFNQEK
ncbi:hypothetical protein [Mesobacillus zeae]|nr:hypothetical protein [Mesobacillus zeae]